MTFPIPSAKLFSTETTAVQGQIDNKANAVVNLTISPKEEQMVEYKDNEQPDSSNPYGSGVFVVDPKYVKGKNRDLSEPTQSLESKHECFYRTVLEAYMSNPLYVNHCVLMKTNVLTEFIKVLTDADKVEIDTLQDISCCGRPTKYNAIENIVVIKNNVRSDFKVSYNEWYRMLKDYRISLKFTVD